MTKIIDLVEEELSDPEKEEKEKAERELLECLEDPRVTSNDDGTRTVKLLHPLKTKQGLVSEITFREPVGRDFRAMDKGEGELEKTMRLAASCADVAFFIFDNMRKPDFELCMQVLATLGKGLPTGGTSQGT